MAVGNADLATPASSSAYRYACEHGQPAAARCRATAVTVALALVKTTTPRRGVRARRVIEAPRLSRRPPRRARSSSSSRRAAFWTRRCSKCPHRRGSLEAEPAALRCELMECCSGSVRRAVPPGRRPRTLPRPGTRAPPCVELSFARRDRGLPPAACPPPLQPESIVAPTGVDRRRCSTTGPRPRTDIVVLPMPAAAVSEEP